MWKVVLLGLIAALLIALGAGMSFLPDPSNSVDAYQQATPCTVASVPSDNCYAVVPVNVVSASAHHFQRNRQDEEHVIVQAPSGPSEIILPWESQQEQVLLAARPERSTSIAACPRSWQSVDTSWLLCRIRSSRRRKPHGSAGYSPALGW